MRMTPHDVPIRRIHVAPPLQPWRTGPNFWLSLDADSLEEGTYILAQLGEHEHVEIDSVFVTLHEWEELVPKPNGEFEVLEGGRAGTLTENPAIEINGAVATEFDVVLLRPGAISEGHGLEWWFTCGCSGPGTATGTGGG